MQEISPETWLKNIQSDRLPLLLEYGMSILFALITLAIGWWLINRATNGLTSVLQKRNADAMLTGFLSSLTSALLRILLLLSVAGMLGIETTSFIALIGAAGLAVGLALQGSLANFAGGVLILFYAPSVLAILLKHRVFLARWKASLFSTQCCVPQTTKPLLYPTARCPMAASPTTPLSPRAEWILMWVLVMKMT